MNIFKNYLPLGTIFGESDIDSIETLKDFTPILQSRNLYKLTNYNNK